MGKYLTLSQDNKFQFKCPIFDAKTAMSSCIKLRNLVWMGKNPEIRKGCQACMSAGKCPAIYVVKKFNSSSPSVPVPDDYGSKEPVMGKIRRDVLERIQNVIVTSSTMARFSLTDAEITLINSSSERIRKALGSAPLEGSAKKRSVIKSKPKTEKTTEQKAAETGNMAAALKEGK